MKTHKRGTSKPRNPLVAPALLRKAGSHQPNRKQERQRLKREMCKSNDDMH